MTGKTKESGLKNIVSMEMNDYYKEIVNNLTKGKFLTINELKDGKAIPTVPGLYCIKVREGRSFPEEYGKIREDGIIYIGKAESSLRKRLLGQELTHKGHATFFRSIGAILGKRPPKGSLFGSDSSNYKFDIKDTEDIKKWISQNILVKFYPIPISRIKLLEKKLIEDYCPLVNIKGNPQKSKALEAVRKECIAIARLKP